MRDKYTLNFVVGFEQTINVLSREHIAWQLWPSAPKSEHWGKILPLAHIICPLEQVSFCALGFLSVQKKRW